MKKIINCKLYDTDTARELATYTPHPYSSNFDYYVETLYIKRTGEYFLHGEGGPMSIYAEHISGCYAWGEKIVPLTNDMAKAWAETHVTADEYIEIFGGVEE